MPRDIPSREEAMAELGRILASNAFIGVKQDARKTLSYLVECALIGKDVKEMDIALDVFGRKKHDPKKRSFLRAGAGRLRKQLAEYYAAEGMEDALVITLPLGSYELRFERRRAQEHPQQPDNVALALWPHLEPIITELLNAEPLLGAVVSDDEIQLPTECDSFFQLIQNPTIWVVQTREGLGRIYPLATWLRARLAHGNIRSFVSKYLTPEGRDMSYTAGGSGIESVVHAGRIRLPSFEYLRNARRPDPSLPILDIGELWFRFDKRGYFQFAAEPQKLKPPDGGANTSGRDNEEPLIR